MRVVEIVRGDWFVCPSRISRRRIQILIKKGPGIFLAIETLPARPTSYHCDSQTPHQYLSSRKGWRTHTSRGRSGEADSSWSWTVFIALRQAPSPWSRRGTGLGGNLADASPVQRPRFVQGISSAGRWSMSTSIAGSPQKGETRWHLGGKDQASRQRAQMTSKSCLNISGSQRRFCA